MCLEHGSSEFHVSPALEWPHSFCRLAQGQRIHLPVQAAEETHAWSRQEDPPEEETATHAGVLAWEIPLTEEPGGLQSMGSQRVKGG